MRLQLHIVYGELVDTDEHAAKWEAYIARKAVDIGKSIKIEHKKSKTMWEWTIVEDHIPDKTISSSKKLDFVFLILKTSPAAQRRMFSLSSGQVITRNACGA